MILSRLGTFRIALIAAFIFHPVYSAYGSEVVGEFSLPAFGEHEVTIVSEVPVMLVAETPLTGKVAQETCQIEEKKKHTFVYCLELEQLKPPAPSQAQPSLQHAVRGNQITGGRFTPSEGKIVLKVRSLMNKAAQVTLTRR